MTKRKKESVADIKREMGHDVATKEEQKRAEWLKHYLKGFENLASGKCPLCGEATLKDSKRNVDEEKVYTIIFRLKCKKCKKTWREQYSLERWAEIIEE